MARACFIELPARDIKAAKDFYSKVFDWQMTEFGPTYTCTMTGDVDIGLQADASEATRAPLAVIAVTDLEATLEVVLASGGKIVKPIFSFPGGRRFHFLDPNGNELAALVTD